MLNVNNINKGISDLPLKYSLKNVCSNNIVAYFSLLTTEGDHKAFRSWFMYAHENGINMIHGMYSFKQAVLHDISRLIAQRVHNIHCKRLPLFYDRIP